MSALPISPAGIPSPTDARVADLVGRWVAAAGADPVGTLSAVVARCAAARGLEVTLELDGAPVEPSRAVLDVPAPAEPLAAFGPWLPGFVREALTTLAGRRSTGTHHTPPDVAATIVSLALAACPSPPRVVADPSVGGGVFLLALAEQLDGTPSERLTRLVGCDTDPVAIAVSKAALSLWADGATVPDQALRVNDFLGPEPFSEHPDLIVGNPPFLSQLRGDGIRDADARERLRRRWPGVGPYVDVAGAFLLAAIDLVDEGGVVALVQPTSFLAARDSEGVRAGLLAQAALAALWVDGRRQFGADVDTVAPVLVRGGSSGRVRRVQGASGTDMAPRDVPAAGSWAPLIADLEGLPPVAVDELQTDSTLGGVATLTAGFRDEYYGLRGAVHDDPSGEVRLITSGLIDPLELRWGTQPARFDRRRWAHPCVDLAAVDPAIRDWVRDRLVAKLLVATQTKVVEVVVDTDGIAVPSTPVVSVEPAGAAPTLWHLAAALVSPVAAALVVQQAAGSALSRDAVRVSAARLAELPLPRAGAAWDAAARAAAEMQAEPSRDRLRDVGRLGLAAYGVPGRDDLLDWWMARLPRNRD